jgi:hypothetical protein
VTHRLIQLIAVCMALIISPMAAVSAQDAVGLPQEIIDEIRSDAADRIIFEDDHGILLIDTMFQPKKIYDGVDPRYRSALQENVYRDLMRFMAGGEREMVGMLLLIKSGGFVWPADLRFRAVLTRKDRVMATVPMSMAVFALVGKEDSLEWIELGSGVQRTLVPRDDRLVPPQLEGMPSIYRIYMLFPARVEIEGAYRGWDPFRLGEVMYEPDSTGAMP